MGARRVLVVEDRVSLRKMLERALETRGFDVAVAGDAETAIERLDRDRFALVLTDLKLPGASGLEVVAASKAVAPETPVVVMTAYGTVSSAVEAMKLGAHDFLEKPVEIDDLFDLVETLLGEGSDEPVSLEVPGGPPIVGCHPRLRAAIRLLRRVAPTETTVLLTGESGTGKELFARALHAVSRRSKGPFVAVNCAALPETLLENELFGHEKGAFTGAHRAQPGRFERAEGGTLLLDEIGELGLGVQAKILRVLEERTFERVGGGGQRRADVRLVAATNRDLSEMVREGTFRSDLYYRLDVFPILLPALRERRSDIPLLVRHLLARLAEEHDVASPAITPDAESVLTRYTWPGNVRELANVLERAVILHPGERLSRRMAESLLSREGRTEREEVRRALEEAEGDKRRAAEILGVSYETLQRRVRRHDLEGFPRYRP